MGISCFCRRHYISNVIKLTRELANVDDDEEENKTIIETRCHAFLRVTEIDFFGLHEYVTFNASCPSKLSMSLRYRIISCLVLWLNIKCVEHRITEVTMESDRPSRG